MPVRDIATGDVVTVDIDATVREVADLMRERRVGSLVVLDGRGQPAGIVTDRDLVVYVCDADRDPGTTTANEVMAREIVSVAPDEAVSTLARRMAETGVRRVPVVEDGELVGIVALDDVLRYLRDVLSDLLGVVAAESPR